MPSVKLLSKVIHNGRFVEAGKVIELEAEHADKLIELGVAEAESAVRRITRGKGKGDGADGDGDGD